MQFNGFFALSSLWGLCDNADSVFSSLPFVATRSLFVVCESIFLGLNDRMFDSFLTKIFGSRNDRLIKQYRRKVALINKLEPAMQKLSDADLAKKTEEFRERYAKGETLEKLLPEAFAVAREASVRVLG